MNTEYVLRMLGLDICADTPVGNEMIRGISGGQKKRVTAGEMIVSSKTVRLWPLRQGLGFMSCRVTRSLPETASGAYQRRKYLAQCSHVCWSMLVLDAD